jgi:hypothetical protein
VPAPIMAFADRLLPAAAPGLRPTRSVRESGRAPTVVLAAGDAGDGGGDGLGETVAAQAGALAGRWLAVGVVCPDDRREDVLAALGAAGVAAATGAGALGWADGEGATPVAVVSPTEAKGLEFDGVVVVEPARFLRTPTDRAGARLLYVALTRAVQELVVVHGEPLPEALAA